MPDLRHRLSAPKWLAVLALLVALVPAVARADQSTERAKQLFQDGTTLFNVGEFDKAIEAWQQGYKEKPDPGFLYNIGQAYRLKGDNQKAIFFYRGYLRNSPKAANKADVEAKIAQLQKALEAKNGTVPTPVAPAPVAPTPVAPAPAPVRPAPAPAPPPAPFPSSPTPVGPTPIAPPPVDAPPLAGSTPSTSSPAGEVSVLAPPPLPQNHPVDVGVSMGFNAWASGLRGKVQPSFALDLDAGFAIGNVYDRASFRLGGMLGLTSLSEPAGKVKFTSLLAGPSVRVRMVPQRLYFSMGLGLGALFISGIKSNSALLILPPPGQSLVPPSTITLFEGRLSAGLQFHFLPRLVGSMTPALSWSPVKDKFYEKIIRFELLFGLSLHA